MAPFDRQAIRLAAFDLDGTIFDRGELLDETREAIERLAASGVETVIATGRHPFFLPDLVTDIKCFRYAIASNGAMVADIRTHEVFSVSEMSVEAAREVVSAMMELSNLIHIVHREGGVINTDDLETIKRNYPDPARARQVERELLKMYRTTSTDYELLERIDRPVIKCGVRFGSPEGTREGARKLRERLDAEVVITDSNMVEVTVRGVSKATGLKELTKRLGMTPQNAVAFGDSGNDIEIMRASGYSVAMGNATDDVKQAASYVTDSVENAGAAKAIRALWGI